MSPNCLSMTKSMLCRLLRRIAVYGGPICQDSKSASFKVDYVSLLSMISMNLLGSA